MRAGYHSLAGRVCAESSDVSTWWQVGRILTRRCLPQPGSACCHRRCDVAPGRSARGETTMPDRSDNATLPAETAYCLTCGFEHTRRPDWLCPRCGMPAGTEPPRRGSAAASAEEPAFPLGSTIAGAVIAVNGLALLIGFLRHPASEYRWALLGTAAFLVLLALELLLKVRAGRWVALVAVVVAALIVSEGVVRERVPDLFRDPLPDPIRRFLRDVLRDLRTTGISFVLGFDVGCLLLVIGQPRKVRIAAGVALAVPLAALALFLAFAR